MVAFTQSFMDRYSGKPTSKQTLYHRLKAITDLRNLLDGSKACWDDATVLAVLHIFVTDILLGDLKAAKTHRAGLKQLLSIRGGINHLSGDGTLKRIARIADNDYRWATGMASMFDSLQPFNSLSYATHAFDPGICQSFAYLPRGFTDLALGGNLSSQLLNILDRMGQWHQVTERHFSNRNSTSCSEISQADRNFLLQHDYTEDEEILYTVLKLLRQHDESPTPTEDSIRLEVCLCHALVAYSHVVFSRVRTGAAYLRARQALTESLKYYQAQPESEEHQACLVWMSLVTINAWRTVSEVDPTAQSLFNTLLDQRPELREWLLVEAIIQKFFCYAPILKEWKETWRCCLKQQIRRSGERTCTSQAPPNFGYRVFLLSTKNNANSNS